MVPSSSLTIFATGARSNSRDPLRSSSAPSLLAAAPLLAAASSLSLSVITHEANQLTYLCPRREHTPSTLTTFPANLSSPRQTPTIAPIPTRVNRATSPPGSTAPHPQTSIHPI